ncbi:MFS general substrate transporter [Gonapodya prolifera JEL478]|uniref:MFS general substrate transporter n=1 Tax=Gonapodya prolifera (strain JEL478) TaxID=1344416 RepID=A0A138ZZ81_GONPJ|nr:MFS general substrate transporter [Gonapodya prolifera JEL478]|eukprot:KXS09800.1 MFS general substrate transporter [Gonapodya prolifera JEL478]
MADSANARKNSDAIAESGASTAEDVETPLKGGDAPEEAVSHPPQGAALVYSPFQFTLLFIGLAISVFLTTLDQTIVAVANPSIVTDFQTFAGLSWIGTAFFLGSIPLIPTYGKLADVFGRKPVFIGGILIFELGSLICGVAQNMNTLIVGRAVAGLGSGCIFPMTIVIISDIVPIENRSRYQGIIGACFGLSSVVGPLSEYYENAITHVDAHKVSASVGGAFTDHLTWRWCFYINFPIGGVGILIVLFFLRLPPVTGSIKEKLGRVDYIGTFWLAAGTVLLVYAISAGGNDYPWKSALIISMIVVGAICLAVFALVETYVVKTPLIPFELCKNRFVVACWSCAFLFGFCSYSLSYYVPIYFQVVNGNSATEAGIHTIPLILMVAVFSLTSGFLISFTGYTAPFVHFGSACIAIGSGLISTMSATSSLDKQVGYLLLTGIGMGSTVQSINLNGQGSVHPRFIGMAISGWSFSQLAGGVFGIAISGTIFSNALTGKLAAFVTSPELIQYIQDNPSKLQQSVQTGTIPAELLQPTVGAYTDSLALVFRAIAGVATALFIVSFLLRLQKFQRKEVVKADKGPGAA